MSNNCVFCRIISRELPSSIVFENDEVIAIMDIQPINHGHVLVIPKTHYASLREVPDELGGQLFKVVAAVEKALWKTSGIRCEGTNILQNNGQSAWQDVFHVHFHVIPRFEGDAFRIKIPRNLPERTALDHLSQQIGLHVSP